MDFITYRRVRRRTPRTPEVKTGPIVNSYNHSEFRKDQNQILKQYSRKSRAADSVAHQKGKIIQEYGDISGRKLIVQCLFDPFPRRQRSKRRINHNNATVAHSTEHHADGHLVEHQNACRKRNKRQEAGETNDPEVVPTSFVGAFCHHERSYRRFKCKNVIAQQQQKLDTNLFEHYLENLWRSFSEEKRDSFTYLDCLWFSLYSKESSKAKVLNWIKKKHIFSKKYVFVPIVQWCHWSLLIFCHFGESLQSKTRTPCMLLLDSLQMANPKRLEPGIRKFVLDIYKSEERVEDKRLIYRIPLLVPKVPQQRNGEECGSFVLYYMNLFTKSAPENFSISEGYPYFMKQDWFTTEGLEGFCKELDVHFQ